MNTLITDTYIVDGNITIFFGPHPKTFKTDILRSSLFGQLLANKSTEQSPSPDMWFTSYQKTLGSFFWNSISNGKREQKKETYSIYNLAKSGLSGALNEKRFAQLASVLSVIAALPEGTPAIKAILQKNQQNTISSIDSSDSTQGKKKTFSISTLLTLILENKTLISLYLSFETTSLFDINMLVQAIPQQQLVGDSVSRTWSAYLMESAYAEIRSSITDRISKHIESKILHITLPTQ